MPPLMIFPPDKHYLTEFTHLGKHLPTEVSQRAPTLAPPTSIFTMFSNIKGRIYIIYFVQMNMNIVCGVCYVSLTFNICKTDTFDCSLLCLINVGHYMLNVCHPAI